MADAKDKPVGGNRLAKVIARAGLCSRREAETWIVAGRVSVNGKPVRTPAFNVLETDKVMVDKEPLVARAGTRVWLYHKPSGLVVTENDPEGRATIFDALEQNGLPRVLTVGRLDINTEGLLLLTNDGGLKRVLELPATGWLRRYRVRAHGRVTQEQLDSLKKGITVDGITYGPIEASIERVQGANVWMIVALREGKNREVKNVFAALGMQVNRLIRVSYGPFQLGDLPIGGVTVVRARVLRDQLGTKLAKEAGVDFVSPLPGEEDAAPDAKIVARDPNRRMRKATDGPEAAEAKPRGRTGAPRSKPNEKPRRAPERKGNFDFKRRPDKIVEPAEKRVVHYTDGRESEEFEPKAKRPRADDDGPPNRGGARGGPRSDGDRPRRDGPRPPRREPSERPGRRDGPSGEKTGFGARPAGGKPGGSRFGAGKPARADGDRSDASKRSSGPRGGGRPSAENGPRKNSSGPRSGPGGPRGGPGGSRGRPTNASRGGPSGPRKGPSGPRR